MSKKPRARPPAKRAPKGVKSAAFWIGFVVLALFLAAGINMGPPAKSVSYSEIKERIRKGDVASVALSTKFVEARLKNSEESLIAVKVEDRDLVTLLDAQGIKYEARNESGWLRELFFTYVLPMILILVVWQLVMGRMFKQGGPPGLMAFGKSKAKLVADSSHKTTFKDVAGADEAKDELREIVEFLKTPQKFVEIGGKIPKGVLLVGPPGTGKTLLARAVAGEAGVNFFQISGSDFVEMFVGVGAARVRDLFAEAAKRSPCIIFIDELDAIAKSRSSGMLASNDEREQTLNQILVEMDGFDNHAGVILMAATNRPEVLDSAILRPGRFDRQIVVDRPDVRGREEILKVHARTVKIGETVDFKTIAQRTPGFSGADLANIVNEAALLAVRKGLKEVNCDCFEEAIDRVIAGLQRKSRVINEREKRVIAIHEVGHAIVAKFTEGADKVHRISIIPRASGALGFTMQLPQEDRYLMSQTQLRGLVRVLLGGRAAEKVVVGEVTSGASDDLRRASEIVRKMISELGMSDSLGLVSLGSQNSQYLNNPFIRQEYAHVSEDTAQKMDRETQQILGEEFENACSIIRSNRSIFDRVSESLLEKETLEQEDFDRLTSGHA